MFLQVTFENIGAEDIVDGNFVRFSCLGFCVYLGWKDLFTK